MSKEKGYIYIMTNPALMDMVKIGFAKDVEVRRKQLRGYQSRGWRRGTLK